MSRWRLIVDGWADGLWNMGVDEALLKSAVSGGVPTLRFYRWRGPWLSLGYSQRPQPELYAACSQAGVGVVRRVTGGRAVLHGADLTYALAGAESELPAGRMACYERVATALLAALRGVGVCAAASPASTRGPNAGKFDCFAEPAGREICVGGKKLAGSAQRRSQGGILQHGSIRLFPDSPSARSATSLSGQFATSLAELGVESSPDGLQEACIEAFAEALGADFERGSLQPAERARAARRGQGPLARPDFFPAHPA